MLAQLAAIPIFFVITRRSTYNDNFLVNTVIFLVLVILAAGQLINAATGSVGFLLSMTGNERVLFSNVGLAAVLGLLFMIGMASDYGATGVALGVAVAVALESFRCFPCKTDIWF